MSEIASDVRAFIVESFLFGDEPEDLTLEGSLLDAGIIDSTGVLELVGFLEDTYAIEVEDDELVPANLDSLKCIASYVERKKAA